MIIYYNIWGFPKIRDTFSGVPIIRILVYWVYIGVPLLRETTIYYNLFSYSIVYTIKRRFRLRGVGGLGHCGLRVGLRACVVYAKLLN